jgi:predicted AAA+ superfamily ATPase
VLFFIGTLSKDIKSARLEYLIFCQLHRQRKNEIYYWANPNGLEVDFVVKRGTEITDLIQVCESLSDTRTKQREIRALLKAMDEFGLNSGTILTYDEYSTEKIDDKLIIIKPIWLWLLES